MSEGVRASVLADVPIHIRFKLSALWASVTLCYLYCDFFELYQPGKLSAMLAGQMGPLGPTTQGVLLGASIVLAIPATLVALCILLPPPVCRGVNLLAGGVFTLIMGVLLPRVWHYYQFFATVEILITGGVVWLAWHWPRADARVAPR